MLKSFGIGGVAAVLVSTAAMAGPCETNFSQDGVPLVTAISFRSWQAFPGVDANRALDRLARAVQAEGFVGMRVDRGTGSITAYQETSGSGREQMLRVVARSAGRGSRVDIVFQIQQGQVADGGTVRTALCRVVAGTAG
jgi:secreted protein with Ig-like and vWFA domain